MTITVKTNNNSSLVEKRKVAFREQEGVRERLGHTCDEGGVFKCGLLIKFRVYSTFLLLLLLLLLKLSDI